MDNRQQYKVTYLLNNEPKDYWVKADSAKAAEDNCLDWAKDLPGKIRVVDVERVEA